VTQGNSRLVYKALKSLDLYVVKDFWLTPSAELADYVLPSACWLERPDMHAASGTDTGIMAGYPVLPAIVLGEHEYWTEYDFFCKLGRKMGQQEFWPWNNLEEARDYQLKPLGLTYMRFMEEKNGLFLPANEYRKHEKKGGFGTPTGKIELYSTILEKLGYDPLPRYDEPSESSLSRPDLAEEFPLTLINGGRVRPYFQSEHRQIDSMRKRHPNPLLQIHPQTAQKLGIDNGDWVWIETPSGRIRQKSLYFEGIDPRVVHAEHGWWFPELPGEEPWLHGVWESNVNVLTDDSSERCNKVSGGWPLRTNLCKVYKVKTF
jgi:anaerobic selenocysteine-containing dehydrogenase